MGNVWSAGPTLFSIVVLMMMAQPGFSADCQCPTASPQDLLETATAVFRGTLDEIRSPKNKPVSYLFVVNDTFKGTSQDEWILQDADAESPCALTFEKNKEYMIYERWQWGYQKTARCWGTKEIAKAAPDRTLLGPGDEWKEKLYTKIRETCMGRYDTSCCLSSVKAMEQGHYLPEAEDGCPDGFQPNVVHCKGSQRWCEPIVGNTVHHP
jgi:hypothetical protein